MQVKAIMLDPADNTATCMHGAKKGDIVQCVGGTNVQITCTQDIPECNKIALQAIPENASVLKYGEVIGAATENISTGSLVSHLNIRSLPRNYTDELI